MKVDDFKNMYREGYVDCFLTLTKDPHIQLQQAFDTDFNQSETKTLLDGIEKEVKI